MASRRELYATVITALDRCLAMQAEHLAGLRNGSLSRINQWIEERQHMVARLRQAMAEAQESGVSPDVRDVLLDKLSAILEGEKAISDIARNRQGTLHEQISSLRRGKKILNGYGMTLAPAPQFVSQQR